ncbi:MAG: hypothetical protein DIU71_01565 [Proteobacteria bacterium]|nr:MAG: hypothetical protein DIU71_01565 [Pseudomonadota bacterium]
MRAALAMAAGAMALMPAIVDAGGSDPRATASAEDVNARAADGSTALLWAAHRGDVAEVERLIRAGADVTLANNYGATPMMEAAIAGNARLIELLLEAGADVESANAEGQTALMAVARTGRVDAAKILLKAGADVNAREQWGGQTALIWAAAQGHPEMIELLIKHGADPNARSVVRNWQRKVTAEGRPKDMNRGGFTPLLYAAREGCVECARKLLAGGADIDLPDPDNTTALVLALMNLRWDFAKFMIESGANVNDWDFWGNTPLYVAVDMNTLPQGGRIDLPAEDATSGIEVIELLLKAGANPNAQLKLRPPYRNAVFDRNTDHVLVAGATPLLRAAVAADVPAMELLLAHGALVDLPNADGVTPLMAAAGYGRAVEPTRGRFRTERDAVRAVRLLLDAGADPRLASLDRGETALHGAALRGWNEVVRMLAEAGADLDAQAVAGLTPLDFALGRYQPGFLEPQPAKHPQTEALLRSLGATRENPNLPPWKGVPTPTIQANVPKY